MPIFAETTEKIYGDIINDVLDETGLTRISRGSKMRALVDALSKKLGSMWLNFDLNMTQAFVDGARGQFLDLIGYMLGVDRLGEKSATVASADKTLRFYVDVGTFGDINSGSSILIPQGTVISSGPNTSGQIYIVSNSTVLLSTESEAYVSAESSNIGEAGNVGSNVLVYHSFTNYTDVQNGTLKVTNSGEIQNGSGVESDGNYRFRMTRALLAGEAANETAIRLAVLAVPGVADVFIAEYARGIGSSELLIKPDQPTVAPELLAAVRSAVENVKGHGLVVAVRGPDEVGVSLTVTLKLKKNIKASDQQQLVESVERNLSTYINSLDIGEELIINEIVERIMSTADIIKDLGVPNKPLDSIFIYRPSKLYDNKIRSSLLGNYKPQYDERVIVEQEYAGATPILVKVA